MMKVGDKARITEACAYDRKTFPVGAEVTIMGVDENQYLYPYRVEDPQEDDGFLFSADELEPISADEVPAGTRVRCTNTSSFNGKTGTVTGTFHDYHCIRWDGVEGEPGTFGQGGSWSREAFEILGEEEEEEVAVSQREIALAAAVRVAAAQFGFYAEHHLNKGTPEGLQKSFVNIGLEALMLNALDTD